MNRRALLLVTLGLLVSAGSAQAHGVNVEISFSGAAVIARSSFSPTQPLVDALVSIYSPADPDNAWQTGRTDKTGHFAFMPDDKGEWIFVVDDQKGHMKRTTVEVLSDQPATKEIGEEMVAEVAGSSNGTMSRTPRIIMGLSLIFGITGIFYGLKARQAPKA